MPKLGPDAGQSDEQLDHAALIRQEDIDAARAAWKKDAPVAARSLLDAKLQPTPPRRRRER